MEVSESLALKLISEMKKPGRECMYDMSNSSFKNNHTKQRIWLEIASAIGIERSECQALWKTIRRRYKSVLTKTVGKSGSERVEVKGFSKMLIAEMDYFQNFWNNNEPTVRTYVDLSTQSFRNPFDEMAHYPDVNDSSTEYCEWPTDNSHSREVHRRKRIKLHDVESEYKECLKTLNTLATTVLQSSSEKIDPFFLALEDEFKKVPDNRKSVLKVKLMSLIVEHQE